MKYIRRQKSVAAARKQMVGIHNGDPVIVRAEEGDVLCVVGSCRATPCIQCVLVPSNLLCRRFRGARLTSFIPVEEVVE